MAPHGYVVGEALGQGGMGRVFAATRTWDGLRVALKMLHPALSRDPVARRSMATEALATAALDHPHIARVFDLDEHPEHGLFLVLELVAGDSLRRRFDAGIPVSRGLAMLRDVATALAAAHAAGVVHGDLKPANVLLGEGDTVKVCDFGIAQIMAPTARGVSRREVAGTPRYMAPEQFVSGLSLDPRTDVYALGVMLYELIYRASPFPRGDMARLASAKLEPVHAPALGALGEGVPRPLRDLMTRAMHPNLRTRPRFAAELAAVLATAWPDERQGDAGARAQVPRRAATSVSTPSGPAELLESVTTLDTWAVPDEARTQIFDAIDRAGRRARPSAASGAPGVSGTSFLPTSHPPGTALIHMRPPPIIGRDAEKGRLLRVAAEVLDTRCARVVVVTGPPGVGKSRLAEWACAWAESTGAMEPATARFSSYGGRNGSGLRGVVSAFFAPSAIDLADAVRSTTRWIARGAVQGPDDEDTLLAWLGSRTSDCADPHGVASLAFGALESYAKARPVCVWFDDLSLAEDGSIDLVARIARDRPGAPILVVATVTASAFADPTFRARLGLDAADFERVELGPLDRADRARLLGALLPLAPGEAERAADAIGGLPSFIVQRVEHWVDRRLLVAAERGLALAAQGDELHHALDDDGIVDDRLDAHVARSPHSANVLYLLALLGPHGDGGSLALACERIGVDASVMDLVLEEALCHGILRARADEVAFAHGSLRASVLRRAWSGVDPARLSAIAAKVLTERAATERPGARSYVALLLRDAGDGPGAFQALVSAAETMAWGGDFDMAEQQLTLLRRWGLASSDAWPRALTDEADLTACRLAYFRDDLARARHGVDLLIARLAPGGPSPLLARALYLSANVFFFADRVDRCEEVLGELRRIFPDARDPMTTLGGRAAYIDANVACLRDDLAAAAAAHRRTLESPDVRIRWTARVELAEIEAARGEHATAREMLERVRTECGPLDVYQLRAVREKRLSITLARGDHEERRLYEEMVRAQSGRWNRTAALVILAAWDAAFAPGRLPSSAREALEAFAQRPHDEALSHALLVRVRNALRRGGQPQLAARATMLLAERAAVGAKRA